MPCVRSIHEPVSYTAGTSRRLHASLRLTAVGLPSPGEAWPPQVLSVGSESIGPHAHSRAIVIIALRDTEVVKPEKRRALGGGLQDEEFSVEMLEIQAIDHISW